MKRFIGDGLVSPKWGAKFKTLPRELYRRKEGQSLVEYVLILSLISIVMIAALSGLGSAIVDLPIASVIAAL